MRRGAGVVERAGFENRCALAGTVGSNPTLSATSGDAPFQSALSFESDCEKILGVSGCQERSMVSAQFFSDAVNILTPWKF